MPDATNSSSSARPGPELERALAEIARIERNLVDSGQHVMLERFGNVEAGAELARVLGFALLAPAEARTVDRLRYFPDGAALVRSYLAAVGVPRSEAAQRMTDEERAGAGCGSAGLPERDDVLELRPEREPAPSSPACDPPQARATVAAGPSPAGFRS